MLNIKKYANRKYYLKNDSRYVTVQEVGLLVAMGNEVKAVDHNGCDVTFDLLIEALRKKEESDGGKMNSATMNRIVTAGGLTSYIQELESKLGATA